MRSIVRKILSASRFALEVQEAEEGIAALGLLRTGNFGIVFLDYNMPGLNGFETLSEIKREIPGVAVVMMTSTLDNAIADRAHASGALAFLKKPFYPKDIDAVLGGSAFTGCTYRRADEFSAVGIKKLALIGLLALLLDGKFAVADAKRQYPSAKVAAALPAPLRRS